TYRCGERNGCIHQDGVLKGSTNTLQRCRLGWKRYGQNNGVRSGASCSVFKTRDSNVARSSRIQIQIIFNTLSCPTCLLLVARTNHDLHARDRPSQSKSKPQVTGSSNDRYLFLHTLEHLKWLDRVEVVRFPQRCSRSREEWRRCPVPTPEYDQVAVGCQKAA